MKSIRVSVPHGQDGGVIRDTLAQVGRQTHESIERLGVEKTALARDVRDDYAEAGSLAATALAGDLKIDQIGDL
jgi:hypothetical protein